MQQSLFILEGLSELPKSECILQILRNRYTHCIILYDLYQPPDTLIRNIDRSLLRGGKTHHVGPLSTILTTQRMVYSIQTKTHLAPKCGDQKIIGKISDFTCGSPILLNAASRILCSALASTQQSPQNSIEEFHDSVLLNEENNGSDATNTSSNYDSWNSVLSLLSVSQIDYEAEFLLYCLSLFGRSPIPQSVVISLSTFITKTSGRIHLASSLGDQLKDKGFIKKYPSPIIFCSQKKLQQEDIKFVCVPRFLSNCFLNQLDLSDKLFALTTTYQVLKEMPKQCPFLKGLVSSLISEYELNIDLVGEICYQEVYRLFLSLFSDH